MTKHFSQKEMATWANVKRSHGSQWGEPSSLKFNYGPAEWSPWNQDLNWRAVCQKENDELDARNASVDKVEGLAVMATGAKQVDRNKAMEEKKDVEKVAALERTLKTELARISTLINSGLEKERAARQLAEEAARAEAAERRKVERELLEFRRMMKRMKKSRSASSVVSRAGSSVLSGTSSGYYSSASRGAGYTPSEVSSVLTGSSVGSRRRGGSSRRDDRGHGGGGGRRRERGRGLDTIRSGSEYH